MIELIEVVDAGEDRLLVRGRDADGNELEATGWVSATTNHYEPGSYDEDGNLFVDARPRAMTAEEVGTYALGLLGVDVAAAAPKPVPFTIAAALADVAVKGEEAVKP